MRSFLTQPQHALTCLMASAGLTPQLFDQRIDEPRQRSLKKKSSAQAAIVWCMCFGSDNLCVPLFPAAHFKISLIASDQHRVPWGKGNQIGPFLGQRLILVTKVYFEMARCSERPYIRSHPNDNNDDDGNNKKKKRRRRRKQK